jgi:hypothetical protein
MALQEFLQFDWLRHREDSWQPGEVIDQSRKLEPTG